MDCLVCGNHEMIEDCRKCKTCDNSIHMMKWGLNWKTKESNVNCPQICKFELPNKQWITYHCHKKEGHDGGCDFQVDQNQLNRLARDSIGGR